MIPSDPILLPAYIGLGSNLAEPAAQLKLARQAIQQIPGVFERAFSSYYQSPPMGPPEQPDYINVVMQVQTHLSAITLLRCLQKIENKQGRVRTAERWGARTLDLDLLLYGDLQIVMHDLIVPHIGITERAFVLYPLVEIAPELVVPKQGAVRDLVAGCPRDGLVRLESI